jgi:hypothetical protein
MWSTFIMDLLLVLQAFGSEVAANSDAAQFDFDSNGVINMVDFLEMLSRQPPLTPPK